MKAAEQKHPQAIEALDSARAQGILRPRIPESTVKGVPNGKESIHPSSQRLGGGGAILQDSGVSYGLGVKPGDVCSRAKDKAACFHQVNACT